MTNPTTRLIATTLPVFDPPEDLPDVSFCLPAMLLLVARAVGFSAGEGGNCKPGVVGVDELVGDGKGGDDVEDGGVMDVFEGGAGEGGVGF